MSEKILGGVEFEKQENTANTIQEKNTINTALPAKIGRWDKVKSFLFQEIKLELTPRQEQIKNDLNDFLHIEITWKDFRDFLFLEVPFGRHKK
ncbi:MAG: hypothetical protein HFJ53_08850 [Clostridia bacterium]|jgi:hypothetical protein|nr:hypothetical protein [Clostridia bacterium]